VEALLKKQEEENPQKWQGKLTLWREKELQFEVLAEIMLTIINLGGKKSSQKKGEN